ncbi:hypothetical protein GH714_010697 [Hevea brasiliensis]|uniref:Uncharacterized protein n=1 Tax=Hevea brasiliensis TaxID=3981 RepID=A0A6A6KF26_HEVBR|nr:hypothetical protein GH714_010697 [Hevea brasiliensis]
MGTFTFSDGSTLRPILAIYSYRQLNFTFGFFKDATGLFYPLSLMMVFMLNESNPQTFYQRLFSYNGDFTTFNFGIGSLNQLPNYVKYEPKGRDFQYMRLDPDGHLRVYQLIDGYKNGVVSDLFSNDSFTRQESAKKRGPSSVKKLAIPIPASLSFVIVCVYGAICQNDDQVLVDVVKSKVEEGQLSDLVDKQPDIQANMDEAVKMLEIAIHCLQPYRRRPSISTVVKFIEGLTPMERITDYSFLAILPEDTNQDIPASLPLVGSILSGPRFGASSQVLLGNMHDFQEGTAMARLAIQLLVSVLNLYILEYPYCQEYTSVSDPFSNNTFRGQGQE